MNIPELARKAGPLISTPFDQWCENFAALIREAERERCAQAAKNALTYRPDLGALVEAAIRSFDMNEAKLKEVRK